MRKTTTVLNTIGKLLLSNKSKINYFFGLMLCIFSIGFTSSAAPSDLDPTFGNGGKVVSSPDGSQASAGNKMALQSDGKIVMVGNKYLGTATVGIIVARYNANGSLDTTFGTNGWTALTFQGQQEVGEAIDVQPDGKIVVGASFRTVTGGTLLFFGVARFNSDGSLDTTFDGDGKVAVDVIDGPYGEYLSQIKVGSDGKIVAAGMAFNSGVDDRFVLIRLNSDGSLDTGFGDFGKVRDHILGPSNHDRMGDMILLPDNSIVVVGKHWGAFTNDRIAVKFNTNGGRAWSYRQGVQASSNEYEALNGVAALPDGKLLVVGKTGGAGVMYRLNANGTQDTSFTSAGMPAGQATSVAVQANGKILVNIYGNNLGEQFALVRFNANGTLDTGFGNNGIVVTPVSDSAYAAKLLIQPDGKYLLGGYAVTGPGYYFALVRYQGEPNVTTARPTFDYDGDGKSDVSVFRPSENSWYILKSSDSSYTQRAFGATGDVPTPSDYDGDGKTDIAIFRPSLGDWWYISSASGAYLAAHWGQNGDIPRPADYDGDGKTDFIVYRPSNSTWYRLGSRGGNSVAAFGTAGDKPLTGDFDGDGVADLAIYRPSTGVWWYAASSLSGAHRAIQFGISTDIPVPADYDGDGKTDFAVYRPSDGGWHIFKSGNQSYVAFPFGASEDKPVPADYDGDGKADVGVFRPSNGSWYILRSTSGFSGVQWGAPTDIPTENSYIQ